MNAPSKDTRARAIDLMREDIRDTKATGFPRLDALRAVSIATKDKTQ